MWSKKHFIIVITTIAVLLAASGCKNKTELPALPATESPNHRITASPNNQNYRTLKAKAVLSLPMINRLNVKATVSVEVGKSIMISLQPLLGMEMYRIVCTGEHIIFIDKLTHSYMAEPYKNFTDKNHNLNYDMVEALLCNRFCDPLQEDYKDFTESCDAETTIYRKQAPNYYVEFLTQNNLIYRTTFASNDGSQYVMADYNSFSIKDGYSFPTAAVCNVRSEKFPLSFNVTFESVEFNADVTISETLPSGYNKLSLETLTQSLFNIK
ncbi:MAG: DUF4292 domain-containing protein [Paludibacteraceae bacterium]|nr:DUF4292 domain-containing protein [Paludibacteraceae bacterium]